MWTRFPLAVFLLTGSAAAGLCVVVSAWPVEAVSPDSSVEPDLLARVRQNLASDDLLDFRYTYRVYRRGYELSGLGKLSNGPERLYEVVRSPVDPEQSWRRLLAINGRSLSPAERRKIDEQHQREAEKARRQRERESPAERARRLRREAHAQQEERERRDDVLRVYSFETAGHEVVDGQRLLVVALIPRSHARPRTEEGETMKKVRAKAWVDEAAGQLVRIEGEFLEDVKVGFGVIGRLHKGSRASYRRAQLPDGTWVPVEATFSGAGKTLMFRPFRIDTWARYTNYRRLPDTAATEAATSSRR